MVNIKGVPPATGAWPLLSDDSAELVTFHHNRKSVNKASESFSGHPHGGAVCS